MMEESTGSVNQLPPGFYFSPTDEELVLHFLHSKASSPCHPNIIPDLDLSLLHPWELNGKALSSGNEHYFFTDGKEKRSTKNGYWMETGVTKPIVSSSAAEAAAAESESKVVGVKKYLAFNLGMGEGTETSWVMEEYHISSYNTASCGTQNPDDEESRSRWVLCRVYEKKRPQYYSQQAGASANYYSDDDSGSEVSWLDQVFMSLDDHDLHETILQPN